MNKFTYLIKKLIRHELVSGSFYIFIGSFIASVLAFVLNLFLARNLSYADYGTYSSLLSVFTLATIPAGSIAVVVVRFATSYFVKNEIDHASSFYKKSMFLWGVIGIIIFILFASLSPFLASFLKINELSAILITGGAISISYLGITNSAFLQALTHFKYLSFMAVLTASIRLFSAAILVIIGYKLFGAVWALIISAILAFLFGLLPLLYLLRHKAQKVSLPVKEIVKYGLPASFAILFLSSFISTDILLVKHFFSPHEAGFYGGLSLIGKVIFYFTGTIPIVMFPMLIKREASGGNVKNLLILSMVLVLIPSLLITAFYFLFPGFTIKLFLGGREYINFAKYLGAFGIFMTLYSLNNVLLNFFLSLKNTRAVYIVGAGAISQIIFIKFFHSSFGEILTVNILTSLFLFVFLLIYYKKIYGFHNTAK